MESGKQKIPVELAEILEEKFSINGWWLLTGKGKMLEKDNNFNEPIIERTDTNTDSNLVNIAYFKDTYAAAGAGAINYDNAPTLMAFDRDFLKVQLGISVFKHIHIIHAIGNSMYPTIQTGEMLFINPFENEDFKIRDKDIYIINTPSGVLVKRIKIENPITKEYSLVSDNPKDKDIPLSGDDFESCTIVGRVIGHFNKL
jgi:phage repressor protein C with HTH and peptisase S24 domain